MAAKKETKKENKKGFLKGLIDNVTENVTEGASFITEKVKETTAKAYVAGSELVEEANEKIHQFTDKQSLLKDKKRIEDDQTELVLNFGKVTLQHYLKNDSLYKTFLNSEKVTAIVNAYKANEKKLKSIDKELKKLES